MTPSARWVRKHSPETVTLEVGLEGCQSDRRSVEKCLYGPGRNRRKSTLVPDPGDREEKHFTSPVVADGCGRVKERDQWR